MEDLEKIHAATARSLGKCRGLLYSLLNEEKNIEEIKRILEITSSQHIAQSLGKSENETSIEWQDVLSKEEQNLLDGHY